MNITDIIFLGWYRILDNTIFSYGSNSHIIGPREHSFFLTFFFHGLNIWSCLRYLLISYLQTSVPVYISLGLFIIFIVMGYLLYFKKLQKVTTYNANIAKTILFIIAAISYAIVSVFLMIKVGDYERIQILLLTEPK